MSDRPKKKKSAPSEAPPQKVAKKSPKALRKERIRAEQLAAEARNAVLRREGKPTPHEQRRIERAKARAKDPKVQERARQYEIERQRALKAAEQKALREKLAAEEARLVKASSGARRVAAAMKGD